MSPAPATPLLLPVDGRQSATALSVQRGTRRLLAAMGHVSLPEFVLPTGRRADVAAMAGDGGIVLVEIKSCLADFRADRKWLDYLPYCDAFYFAVTSDFPVDVLPEDVGLILADGFGGAIARPALPGSLAGARRKAMTLRFARIAALQLHRLADPEGARGHDGLQG